MHGLVGVVRFPWRVLRVLVVGLVRFARTLWRTRLWAAVCMASYVVWCLPHMDNISYWPLFGCLAVWWGPLVAGVVWSLAWPVSFERWIGSRWRRHVWRKHVTASWELWARECGLSVQREVWRAQRVAYRHGGRTSYRIEQRPVTQWVNPKLLAVDLQGATLTLRVRVRIGQTVDDLVQATAKIGTAAQATSWRCTVIDTLDVTYELVLGEFLSIPVTASFPTVAEPGSVVMGRRQNGASWVLPLTGRHTLVAGCSGSGKGSILWGICGGLAPCVAQGTVQLWGIDLKRGVEIGMGRDLFSCAATTPDDALAVLRELLGVIDTRGRRMAGWSRLHEPVPGDPLHVLVIDELAALTAYAEAEVKREANRLLSEVLTQGRALGVVVVACLQDPRKEVIAARGLFTQTLALRLRSADEARMVLGDGMAALAPAHTIPVTAQGMAWIVDDTGHADKVRADYWPDPLIRAVAQNYPAPRQVTTPAGADLAKGTVIDGTTDEMPGGTNGTVAADARAAVSGGEASVTGLAARRARKPRAPRQPRTRRAPNAMEDTVTDWGGDAA